MAAASLDVKFEEELSAIGNVSTLIPITVHSDGHFPQVFMILSEPERTVALCNLLQHSTQVQTCFFIPVLQQIARADFMTALLSPAIRVFMEIQIEAKLASMNVKSNVLASLPTVPLTPTPRTASLSPLTRALPSSPDSTNPLDILKRRRGDPRSTVRQTQSLQGSRPSHIGSGSRLERRRARFMGWRQITWPSRGSITPPLRIFRRA